MVRLESTKGREERDIRWEAGEPVMREREGFEIWEEVYEMAREICSHAGARENDNTEEPESVCVL